MKIVFFLNTISPHQIPLADEVANVLGKDSLDYVYVDDVRYERINLGWQYEKVGFKMHKVSDGDEVLIGDVADIVYTGLRCIDMMMHRASGNKLTWYYSERWFKPPIGIMRLLSPRFFFMTRNFVKLLSSSNKFMYLPVGVHAARDMARLCGLFHGDLRCLFRAPRLEFEKRPAGRIFNHAEHVEHVGGDRYCLDKMRMWGYFVEPSNLTTNDQRPTTNNLKLLWVGRLLKLKRVDTIIRAVGELVEFPPSANRRPLAEVVETVAKHQAAGFSPSTTVGIVSKLDVERKRVSACSTCSTWLNVTLDIYGTGPEEARLKKLAAKYGDTIKFHPPVPIAEVRRLMREHDVYVMSSNGYEGWGAVVSEALEEGMLTLGTHEAGSSATILPESHLFHAGDWRALAELLRKAASGELKPTGIGEWTAKKAAELLVVSARKSKKEVPLTKR